MELLSCNKCTLADVAVSVIQTQQDHIPREDTHENEVFDPGGTVQAADPAFRSSHPLHRIVYFPCLPRRSARCVCPGRIAGQEPARCAAVAEQRHGRRRCRRQIRRHQRRRGVRYGVGQGSCATAETLPCRHARPAGHEVLHCRRAARTSQCRRRQHVEHADDFAAAPGRRLPALRADRIADHGRRTGRRPSRDQDLPRQGHRRSEGHAAHGHHPARPARFGAFAERRLVCGSVLQGRHQRLRRLWPRRHEQPAPSAGRGQPGPVEPEPVARLLQPGRPGGSAGRGLCAGRQRRTRTACRRRQRGPADRDGHGRRRRQLHRHAAGRHHVRRLRRQRPRRRQRRVPGG